MRMQSLRRWLVRVLCLGLACLLAVLLVRYQKSERARDEHLAQLHKDAERYEARLKEIEKELAAAKDGIGSENKTGMILLAFQPQSSGDLKQIAEAGEQYGFSPIIVVDAEGENAEKILRAAADAGYEIVLTAEPFGEASAEHAASLRGLLSEDQAASDSGMFLLREAYETEENLALVASADFDGCISYYSHAAFSETHPSFALLHYSYLRNASFSVQKRLNELSDGGEALMFVLDLSAPELSQTAVDRYLSTICGYADAHDVEIAAVAQTIEAIRLNRVNSESGKKAYDRLLAERQEEIEELNAKLDEIYGKWKEVDPA